MQMLLKQYRAFFQTQLMIQNPDMLPHIGIFNFEASQISAPEVADLESFKKLGFIGKRAELFAKHVFSNSPDFRLLSHSLQIFDAPKTLGEFDFIFEDLKASEIIHLEMVYKVYLYDARLSDTPDFCWIGPNRRDSFQEKCTKLKNHQFPLLYHPKTAESLSQLGIDNVEEIQQQLLFKAILFRKFDQELPDFQFLNTLEMSGFWLYWDEFKTDHWQDALYFMPRKANWFNQISDVDWVDYPQIIAEVKAEHLIHRNPMLWVKLRSQTLKIFVVQTDF